MFEHFTDQAIAAIMIAQQEARNLRQTFVGSELVLVGLVGLGEGIAAKTLKELGLSFPAVIEEVELSLGQGTSTAPLEIPFTPMVKQLFTQAIQEAHQLDHNFVAPEHLLLAISSCQDDGAVDILRKLSIDPEEVREKTLHAIKEQVAVPIGNFSNQRSERFEGRTLEEFTIDLTQRAAMGQIDPVVGREQEIDRVVQILGRRSKNNPILIGEPGVGKTAIAEGLAQRIVEQTVPDILCDRQVLSLDVGALIAGTRMRGEFEERLTRIISEVRSDANIILVIDEVHTLVGAGGIEGGMDAANLLKPALARGELQCIGATTLDEYRKYIEKDAALERRFQPVMVDEPTVKETIEILKGVRGRYEQHHRLTISDAALEAAANLSDRYIRDRFLPDKAIDLIDEAGSRVRLQHPQQAQLKELRQELRLISNKKDLAVQCQDFDLASQLKDEEINIERQLLQQTTQISPSIAVEAEDIAHIVTAWTGVPVTQLSTLESANLLKLEDTLRRRIIGQGDAVQAVARAVRRARVGLKNPNRPIASFIFCGPTGVGKTELTKALAASVFGAEDAMIRLDMSEYMERQSVAKLIGSPPGYVGYGEGGQLTEAVRRNPYTVLLLDEIEKAHPDVFNLLLQILEDGRLTDSQGRIVDFKNTLIIMTSNVGSKVIQKQGSSLGFSLTDENDHTLSEERQQTRMQVTASLKLLFRPEFLNRLDDIIVFRQLDREEVAQITDILLKDVADRLSEQSIQFEITPAFKERLVAEGYDPSYGARPLRRAIARLVEDNLAEAMLAGHIQSGGIAVLDIKDNDEVQVHKKQVPALVG